MFKPSSESDTSSGSGAGGLGSGFGGEGYRVALAVEADRHAAQTYRVNNPGVPVVEARISGKTRAASLRKFTPGTAKVDVLLAGPPCQGYSAAGARRPDDPQNELYEHVARLARQLKVEHVVLENVPGVRRVNGQGFLHSIVDTLEGAGYSVAPHLLRASDFGVPQRRVRYFFIGRRGQRSPPIPAPSATHRRHGELPHEAHDLPETPAVTELLEKLPYLAAGIEAERLLLDDGSEFLNMSTMRHFGRCHSKDCEL
ncbi:MAG: DNA (cytosine-5-)-methyltransferase [Actinomycetota bacterium]|nr:DNA (cytosine-5-)-methyltransferase [Actinomycetota bacterium]